MFNLFNNDYDVLWNRVSVNELIEEDPVDPGKEDSAGAGISTYQG